MESSESTGAGHTRPHACPKGFRFLALPPELRHLIYQLLFVSDEAICRRCPWPPELDHHLGLPQALRWPRFPTWLFRVNHQVYNEASRVFYGVNQFHFLIGGWYYKDMLAPWTSHQAQDKVRGGWRSLEAIAPRNLRQITRLSCSMFIDQHDGPSALLRNGALGCLTSMCHKLEQGHHLRTVNIEVTYLNLDPCWHRPPLGGYVTWRSGSVLTPLNKVCKIASIEIEPKILKTYWKGQQKWAMFRADCICNPYQGVTMNLCFFGRHLVGVRLELPDLRLTPKDERQLRELFEANTPRENRMTISQPPTDRR